MYRSEGKIKSLSLSYKHNTNQTKLGFLTSLHWVLQSSLLFPLTGSLKSASVLLGSGLLDKSSFMCSVGVGGLFLVSTCSGMFWTSLNRFTSFSALGGLVVSACSWIFG